MPLIRRLIVHWCFYWNLSDRRRISAGMCSLTMQRHFTYLICISVYRFWFCYPSIPWQNLIKRQPSSDNYIDQSFVVIIFLHILLFLYFFTRAMRTNTCYTKYLPDVFFFFFYVIDTLNMKTLVMNPNTQCLSQTRQVFGMYGTY